MGGSREVECHEKSAAFGLRNANGKCKLPRPIWTQLPGASRHWSSTSARSSFSPRAAAASDGNTGLSDTQVAPRRSRRQTRSSRVERLEEVRIRVPTFSLVYCNRTLPQKRGRRALGDLANHSATLRGRESLESGKVRLVSLIK